jgi:hypothetical protein
MLNFLLLSGNKNEQYIANTEERKGQEILFLSWKFLNFHHQEKYFICGPNVSYNRLFLRKLMFYLSFVLIQLIFIDVPLVLQI